MDAHLDDFSAELRNRWEECQKELQAKEQQARQLATEIEEIKRRADAYGTLLQTEYGEEGAGLARFQDLRRKTIVEGVTAVLSDASLPPEGLHVKELVRRMQERGWSSEAQKPAISVSASLLRSPQFEKTGPNIFRLRADEGGPL